MTVVVRRRVPSALLGAALLSGAAALIFETLWARSLAIIMGSTVHAHSLVFAAFMTGLAIGAYGFGVIADRVERVVRLYGITELAIGETGVGVGLVLHRNAAPLATLMSGEGRLVTSFFLSAALVLLPTALMGATFPLLLRAARRLRGGVGELYGLYAINTLGAAAGTLLTTLAALPSLGVTGSLYLAGGFNLLAAVLVWTVAPQGGQEALETTSEASVDDGAHAGDRRVEPQPWALLLSVFASGFLVLSMEVVWSRLASFFLGNRALAFTVLVAWVLALLAAGSWLAGRLAAWAGGDVQRLLGRLYALAAAMIVVSAALAVGFIDVQASVEATLPHPRELLLFYRIIETGILLAPMMLALGCIFPMSLLAAPGVEKSTGSLAGRFYLVNTVGSVLGSLSSGFWGVTRFGTLAWIGLQVVGCVVVAVALSWRSTKRDGVRAELVPLLLGGAAVAACPLLLSFTLGESVDPERLMYRKEDEYGVLQVTTNDDGTIRVVNNRTELVYLLGTVQTSYVQQMQGHLGMFYKPDAKRAVVLGSGYGITAGALGLYAGLERVDAVEIVPGMVEAADRFMPYNLGYHRNPKVKIAIDDGRHFLTRSDERYDIISVNVSDAHLPGASGLFHREFYAVAKQHLTEGGVVIQHAFGVDLGIVLATLKDSFSHLAISRAYGNGFNVVASPWPLRLDRERVEALVREPEVRAALYAIGLMPPLDVVDVFTASAALGAGIEADGAIATDDFPLLEFSWSGDSSSWLFINE
ncbi:MAG: fused MFS/spermidine synthase [Myxococcales bacterium]|nr:fused MFS/spermidine synthase [Myxococcales bacterium]